MFKILILLDCDECGHSLCKAAVCSSFEHASLCENAVRSLKSSAASHGWSFILNHSICQKCILEEEKIAEWLQQPEGKFQS